MTYFYINPLYINDPDEQAALDRALAVLAGLPLGYLDTLIAAHEDWANAVEAWCDDWRDANQNRDDLDWQEPEDQPEYEAAVEAARQEAIVEHHVTVEQLTHLAAITECGRDGLAELCERNKLFWSIVEAAGMAID